MSVKGCVGVAMRAAMYGGHVISHVVIVPAGHVIMVM